MTNNMQDWGNMQGWGRSYQQAFDSMQKISEINLHAAERFWQEQLSLVNALMHHARTASERAASIKDVQSGMAAQAEITREAGDKIAKSGKAWADIMAEAGKSYSQVFEKGLCGCKGQDSATKQA